LLENSKGRYHIKIQVWDDNTKVKHERIWGEVPNIDVICDFCMRIIQFSVAVYVTSTDSEVRIA
jgi:hypothetical protein